MDLQPGSFFLSFVLYGLLRVFYLPSRPEQELLGVFVTKSTYLLLMPNPQAAQLQN